MLENKKFLRALGKNIDKLRKEKGFSFQEMAHRCEIEKSNLVKLTTEGTNITVNTLYRISKGLGVSIPKIFDFHYD